MRQRVIKENKTTPQGKPVDLELLSNRIERLSELLEKLVARDAVTRPEPAASSEKAELPLV